MQACASPVLLGEFQGISWIDYRCLGISRPHKKSWPEGCHADPLRAFKPSEELLRDADFICQAAVPSGRDGDAIRHRVWCNALATLEAEKIENDTHR